MHINNRQPGPSVADIRQLLQSLNVKKFKSCEELDNLVRGITEGHLSVHSGE